MTTVKFLKLNLVLSTEVTGNDTLLQELMNSFNLIGVKNVEGILSDGSTKTFKVEDFDFELDEDDLELAI